MLQAIRAKDSDNHCDTRHRMGESAIERSGMTRRDPELVQCKINKLVRARHVQAVLNEAGY